MKARHRAGFRRLPPDRAGARARGLHVSKFAIYDDPTVWENLQFYGGVYGINDKASILGTLEHAGFEGPRKYADPRAFVGWRQRLALGIALVHSPKLLFLDAPAAWTRPPGAPSGI